MLFLCLYLAAFVMIVRQIIQAYAWRPDTTWIKRFFFVLQYCLLFLLYSVYKYVFAILRPLNLQIHGTTFAQ